MFLKNNSSVLVSTAKLWISAQEKSPQIKIALERDSGGVAVQLNYSTFVNTPSSMPPGLVLGNFTLAPSEGGAQPAGGTGSLPAGGAQGYWVLEQISEALVGDASVPATFSFRITE